MEVGFKFLLYCVKVIDNASVNNYLLELIKASYQVLNSLVIGTWAAVY